MPLGYPARAATASPTGSNLTVPLGFGSFWTARRTLAGIEAMAMLAKGQARTVPPTTCRRGGLSGAMRPGGSPTTVNATDPSEDIPQGGPLPWAPLTATSERRSIGGGEG
jgi:hypothetical protein